MAFASRTCTDVGWYITVLNGVQGDILIDLKKLEVHLLRIAPRGIAEIMFLYDTLG